MPLKWVCDEPKARSSIGCALRHVLEHAKDELPLPETAPNPTLTQAFHSTEVSDMFQAEVADDLDPDLPQVLATALAHARRELLKCDQGDDPDFWTKVYTSVVGDWLESDMPEVAEEVSAKRLTADYFESVSRFIGQMRWVERFWQGLGKPVRDFLLQGFDYVDVHWVIDEVVQAGELEVDDREVAAWSRRVWHMAQRRGLRNKSEANDVCHTDESNRVIDVVRADPKSHDVCYAVDAAVLPASFRAHTDERQALVVRLSQEWLRATKKLNRPSRLDCFYWTRGDSCDVAPSIGRAFWCSYDSLWPQLFKFRRSIPVLYVFDNQCIFACYQFNHFTDLRAIADVPPKRRMSLDISREDWSSDRAALNRVIRLPHGRRLKPTILHDMVDLTTQVDGRLRQQYLSINPDAALTRVQQTIRDYFARQTTE